MLWKKYIRLSIYQPKTEKGLITIHIGVNHIISFTILSTKVHEYSVQCFQRVKKIKHVIH